MKYIPGKWKVDNNLHADIVVYAPWSENVKPGNTATFGDYRGAHICYLTYNSGVPTKEQAKANALLIASAPELLEACKAMLTPEFNQNIDAKEKAKIWDLATQAITKAEGE